ncbi:MAG TPA: efflux RND transporter periplasmic adaptor subunit [Thiobacillaceae bacterium]|nr:efflux RND transporter periplasmic adaptor subunit [Thiobacillaceae bacterium]HNU63198.1 efflux RND transporter periplasmic adaptor subunit [Thiobacillaceae bacterium]
MNRFLPATVVLLSLILSACGKQSEQQAGGPSGSGMPPPEVEVISVTPVTVPQTISAPGRLTPVRVAQVRARVEGILERREYTEGSEVKAGQVLFRIDRRTLTASQEAAKATLARAKATALIAGQNLDRLQGLKDTQAIAKQEYDQAKAAKAQADADVAAAQAALAQADINLAYATVTAPISGRIGRALVTEGALVGRGEATHLATIEQYDPIWVDFAQSSAEFIRLREAVKRGTAKATRATATLILENGQEYGRPGRLLFNDLSVDPTTGSVGLRAEFANPERELLPGQFVTVRLTVAEAENVMVVPQKAVQVSPQGQMVLLLTPEGMVEPRPVKTAGLSGSDWIITEGLQGGEQVIVNGLQKVRPGAPAKAVSVKQAPVNAR